MFKSSWITSSLVLVLALGALALSGAQNPANIAHATVVAPLGFGIDGSYLQDPPTLARATQAGAQWTRNAVWWSDLEPDNRVPADYNWKASDTDLNPVIAAGLVPVVYVGHTPAWAGPISCGPIDTSDSGKMAEFAQFMGALATHYPQVPIWALYNEADNSKGLAAAADGCFGDDATGDVNQNGIQDVADYAEMLATARKAVRQVEPEARVAISVALDNFDTVTCPPDYPGGCQSNGTFNFNFLPNLLEYMKAHPRPQDEAYADLVGFDYWDVYSGYWEAQVGAPYRGVQAKAQRIRQMLQNATAGLNLFVVATGANSNVSSVGLQGQSQCVVSTMVRGAAANLEGLSWWMIKDIPANSWYYGLVDANLNPKPAFNAYQTLANRLKGYTFKKTAGTTDVEAYLFVQGTQRQFVAWSADVSTHSVLPCADTHRAKQFTIRNATRLQVVDLYQTKLTNIDDNQRGDHDPRVGKMRVKIGAGPTYIRVER